MRMTFKTVLSTMLLLVSGNLIAASPATQGDIDESVLNTANLFAAGHPNYMNGVDYNTVVGHFKDFLMYLPVMMTTVKETMTGFPKLAEGLRVLVSRSGRESEECKCRGFNSNEVDSSNSNINNGNSISRYG